MAAAAVVVVVVVLAVQLAVILLSGGSCQLFGLMLVAGFLCGLLFSP
jgi:hypothetical protein